MRCKYAKRSFFVLLSGHCSAISLVSLSSFVPASEIFLAALITSIVVFKGPRPLKKKNWTVVGHHTFVLTNLIDMEKTIKKKNMIIILSQRQQHLNLYLQLLPKLETQLVAPQLSLTMQISWVNICSETSA